MLKLGGNAPFRDFLRSYTPVEQGGYSDTLSPYDTYHSWAATQYREKVRCLTYSHSDYVSILPIARCYASWERLVT